MAKNFNGKGSFEYGTPRLVQAEVLNARALAFDIADSLVAEDRDANEEWWWDMHHDYGVNEWEMSPELDIRLWSSEVEDEINARFDRAEWREGYDSSLLFGAPLWEYASTAWREGWHAGEREKLNQPEPALADWDGEGYIPFG